MLDWRILEEIQLWTRPLIAPKQGVIWRGSVRVCPPGKNLPIGKREADARPERFTAVVLSWKKGFLP